MVLTNEDNMVVMSRYPDKHFDLAIVDPPYGIGFSAYIRVGGHKVKNRFIKNGKKKWDDVTPSDEYFKELFRVSKNQIIWGGNYFKFLTGCESPEMKKLADFKAYVDSSDQKWIIWNKQNPAPTFKECELAWISFDQNELLNYRYYGNLDNKTSASKKIHPTQKPVGLYKYLLDKYAQLGYKILDTHLGSGTFAIACHDYNYSLTACELDADIFAVSMRSINDHKSQVKMF